MNHSIPHIACFGISEPTSATLLNALGEKFSFWFFKDLKEFGNLPAEERAHFHAVISENRTAGIKQSLESLGYGHLPVSTVVDELKPAAVKSIMKQGVSEVFLKPLNATVIGKKLELLISLQAGKAGQDITPEYRLPLNKRIFDIVLSSLALVALSPLFLIVSILIRISGKGPVFYYSLRVGTGYKIFRFYKFRTMNVDADAKLSGLTHLNQYGKGNEQQTIRVNNRCHTCTKLDTACSSSLFADDIMWCEKMYKEHISTKASGTFMKIKNDPRVTGIGKWLRNTSVDELPQLWNVLKGNMSLVGNRPLPLYEAEKLTTDKYALRFIAPAGITGLWQVSKRGSKGPMSEDERISLDNDYAKNFSLWFDLKLIMRTIPALFQQENV